MKNKVKILIVRLSAIGDVIHSTPVLYSLRQKFPDAIIDWVVEDKACEIIINNQYLNNVYVMPKQRWKKQGFNLKTIKEIISFIKNIRNKNYDIAIDLQELFKSGIITYLSGAKRRIAHAGTRELAHIFVNEKLPAHDNFDPNKLIIERYLESAKYLGADTKEIKFSLPPVAEETKQYIDQLLQSIDQSKPLIIFSPSTVWGTKHWLPEYWTQLLEMSAPLGNIVFCGTIKDEVLIKEITASAKTNQYISLAGKTNLFELIEIFNRSDIVVAPDTGPTHIANATGKPTIISIFGPTSYKRSCPYGEEHEAISANISCQPCFKRKCPRKFDKMECMRKISPELIFNIINKKLTNMNKSVI